MPQAWINGFELHYEVAGNSTPVVYVHGGFASLASVLHNSADLQWDWEWEFAERFRFITYDRRGCYRSSRPPDGYALTTQAMDLERVLDLLEIPSAHIIGSSAGGPIAIIFGATRPDRTRSLILTGTGMELFPAGDEAADIIRQQARVLEQDGVEAAFDRRPRGAEVTLGVLWEPDEMRERGTLLQYRERHANWMRQAEALPVSERIHRYVVELENIRAYMDAGIGQYACQIRAPTLVQHGSNDREVPVERGEEMARAIPNSRLSIKQGMSHSLVIRSPEARQEVIAFIKQVEGAIHR